MDLKRLFEPRSFAVLGASPKRVKGRYEFIRWFIDAGYSGKIYPVNPNYKDVHGHKCYPSLNDVPGEIDLVLIMLPADKTIEALKEAEKGKIKFAFVIASGFSELGNNKLEQDLIETAKEKEIRIIGPNCMGIYSRKSGLAQAAKQPYGEDPGDIAMISQSGGNAANLVRTCENSGVNAHSSVSIGNQSDLSIEDFLSWYKNDKDVKIISGYVEDFRDGRNFIKTAKGTTIRKPLIIWKGGKTKRGAMAASSHTGALAVSGDIWNSIVRQCGIIPADNLLEIVYLSRAILWNKLPQGPGVCLISPGGGHSVVMTDLSIKAGLEVPLLSDDIRGKLSEIIAEVNTIIDNPIDVGSASYHPDAIKGTIKNAAKEKNIHSFVCYHFIYPFKGTGARKLSYDILKNIAEAREETGKPVYVALYRPYMHIPAADKAKTAVIEYLNELKLPYTGEMESCIKMVSRLWNYSRYLQRVK